MLPHFTFSKDEEPFKQSACSHRGKLHVELIFLVKKERKSCVWSQLRLLFWPCWLSRIVLFRPRRQPQGPNSYFKDHRRWSLYKYWIAGLCATHPQESHFNHSHTPVGGWRSNWCNIFQLLSMWLWSDFRAELWFHALSLRDGINWYFSNSAKCGSSNMSGLCVHHETPTGCTYLYFRNYMPRNESGTEIYFSTFISTFDFFWRTTKIRLTDRMLRLFSNS